MEFLATENLSKDFGGLRALNNVSLLVKKGTIHALIGPNGAGKTTIFNIVSGIEKPSLGRIYFKGRNITHCHPYQIARLGIARTFQNLRIFENMTVLENVMTGRHLHSKSSFFSSGLRLPWNVSQEKEMIERSNVILDFLGLKEKANLHATGLPYGERRLLEIARALATEPDLLLFDEPAAGLNSKETAVLAERISQIRDKGITILIVEHDMGLVMMISDQVTVLDYGEVIAEGNPIEIQNNPRVVQTYLGSSDA